MMRAVIVLLALTVAVPASARRPLAPAAQRFVDALDRGDVRALQRVIPRGVTIERMRPNDRPSQAIRPPVTLAGIAAAVRGCHSRWRLGNRELDNRSQMRAFFFWECSGSRDPMVNLTIVDGRVTRIEIGWEIEHRPSMPPPGTTFPPPSMTNRVYMVLHPLVGERNFEGISENLPADAVLFDRLRDRSVDLAAIADHVEPCSLRDVSTLDASSAVTRWACPDGDRAIAFTFDGDTLKRIEIVPAVPPPSQGSRTTP